MKFILLLTLGAILLATTSGFFSIWGLAHTFHGKFWAVIAMGIALEYGKLIGVSFLYRFWNKVTRLVKVTLFTPFIVITLVLMGITATGHYAYLSSSYQIDALPFKQKVQQVDLLLAEKDRRIERKNDIDKQISQLPPTFIKGRERLISKFKQEQRDLTIRIDEIDKKILDLKTEVLQSEAEVGPIIYIAKALNLGIDQATNYLVLLIIAVFDPLAILLTIATNIAIRDREKYKPKNKDLATEEDLNHKFDAKKWLPESMNISPMPAIKEPEIDEEQVDVFSGEAPPGTTQMRLALDALNKKEKLSIKQLQIKAKLEKHLSEP